MFRGRTAAVAAALAIAATAAVTAGCGGGSSASSGLPLDPLAAAATKTQNAGAARIRFSVAVTAPQLGKTLRMRGTGAIDGTSSEMSFKLGSMLGGLALPSSATKKLAHGSLKAVTLEQNGDYVVYLHLGFLSSQLPGGKQWIELDVSKLGKKAGLDVGSLLSGTQFQPADLLGMLEAEGAKVSKVGQATVDGVATTHYHATIDLAKALRSKGFTSPLLSAVAPKLKAMSEDVWVDGNGLVRRIRGSYHSTEAGHPVGTAMTMDLYDYGAHLTIAAPPSSEVFDATQLAQQGIRGSLP